MAKPQGAVAPELQRGLAIVTAANPFIARQILDFPANWRIGQNCCCELISRRPFRKSKQYEIRRSRPV
jgi:hypothetical protein